MSGKRSGPRAPKVRELEFGVLTEASVADLDDDETMEALRWRGADFGAAALRGATFVGCELIGVALFEADLTAARFSDSRVTRVNTPVLKAPDASWTGSVLEGSRIGAWEGYGAHLRATQFIGRKVTYANLRGASLTDAVFTDCTFDELDLMDCTGARVAYANCTIGLLTLHRTKIASFDLRGASIGAVSGMDGLRGATMTEDQIAMLATQFADHLGIVVD